MNKRTSDSPNRLWYLSFSALLASTCREYDSGAYDAFNRGGAPTGGGAHGGEAGESGEGNGGASGSLQGGAAGASGDGGQSGESGDGGRSGAATGGSSGNSSTNGGSAGTVGKGGESGDDPGGDSGGGSGPTPPPQPGTHGAVRLLVGGTPRCGGSLITNDWVLTADQCVRSTDEGSLLEIGFGMDAERFEQTRRVVEIQRFPGNDGTDENRGRDLLLLGVNEPFEIDGQTSGHYRQVWSIWSGHLLAELHRCVGWDLRVSGTSPTSKLREEVFAPFAYDSPVSNGTRPAGDRLWWMNTSDDPEQGALPMQADVGSGCFQNYYEELLQTTVHSGNPSQRRNSQLANNGREAYSVALGERAILEWLDNVLFDAVTEDIELAGRAMVCASGRDQIELFGLQTNGTMGWWTWESGVWSERTPLSAPTGASLSTQVPGVYCTKLGGIELFATGTDGSIWWQSMNPAGQWEPDWERVDNAISRVSSGVAVTGVLADHFHLFAFAETGELRHAEYDGGWTGKWEDLGGGGIGTPSATMSQEGRMTVYVRGTDDHIYQLWMNNGAWVGWFHIQGPVASEPATTKWHYHREDVLTRSLSGTLGHRFYEPAWTDPNVTDIPMPAGTPVAVTRHRGSIDLFVTQEDGKVWHAFFPRKPRPQTTSAIFPTVSPE